MYKENLSTILGLKYPIFWNLAAVEPDFAIRLIYKLTTTRPTTVVEVGAGLSTLITLRTLKNLDIKHKVYSIDADEWFLNETKNLLISEGLYDTNNIEFILAPIENVTVKGKKYLWHDINHKWDINEIDLLVIDGPMGSLSKNSRYPAVPYFEKYLKTDSSILLDDFNRDDERAIVRKWLDEYKYLEFVDRGPSDRGQGELIFRSANKKRIAKDIPPQENLKAINVDEIREELNKVKDELDSTYSSLSWKLGRSVANTYRKINKKIDN